MRAAIFLTVLAAGCVGDLDPAWQLDHDRIVAVRATPPHIPSGATSKLDGLIAHKGAPTDVESPSAALVSPRAPKSLQGAVAMDGSGGWTVTAPDEAALAAARTELMLDPGAPVPLEVAVTFGPASAPLVATKFVYLGDSGDNPVVTNPTVDGAPAPADIVVPVDTDVHLAVTVADKARVNWLTSCGTMHDDDEIVAFVHVLPDDPMTGELAVVVRDATNGVAFETWTIHTPP